MTIPYKRTYSPDEAAEYSSSSFEYEVKVKQEKDDDDVCIDTNESTNRDSIQESRREENSHLYEDDEIPKNINDYNKLDKNNPSTRQKSHKLLMKIFPNLPSTTIEMYLQNCKGNLVEAIECILVSQRCSSSRSVSSLEGCNMSNPWQYLYSSNFPMDRQVSISNGHHSSFLYPSVPPPLLLKPKPVDELRAPAPQRLLPPPPLTLCPSSEFHCTCNPANNMIK